MLSTIIVGAVLAVLLFIAFKRSVNDLKQGGCSGCSSCSSKDKCSGKVDRQ